MNLDEFTKYFLKNKHTMLCPICNSIVNYNRNLKHEYCHCDNIKHENIITRNVHGHYDFYCGIYNENYLFQITFNDNLYRYDSNNNLVILSCKENKSTKIDINLKFNLETPYIDLEKIKSLLLFI